MRLIMSGFPIRTSTDQSLHPAPRRFSQVVTSFIGSIFQGIHYMPLLYFLKKNLLAI